jgi:hypothetical protein
MNKAPVAFDMRDVMDLIKREVFLSLNCHAIATVKSFNSANMTVNAQMNYCQTVIKIVNGVETQMPEYYSPLVDCPVFFLGGGTSGLSFPIAAGDQCLICFNDRDLNNWFAGQHSGALASNRLHSFADGIALVWNNLNPGYDATHASLYNGTTMVGVSATKVKIANATASLGTSMTTLLTALQTFMTATGSATTAAQIATAAAAFTSATTTAITNIGGLLE